MARYLWVMAIGAVLAQDPDKYYGIPLGGVHLSSDATSGELYAFDEYTIFFNHLNHIPKRNGCTVMMLGPPRPQDRGTTLIQDHGIIVPISQLIDVPADDAPPVPVVFERSAKNRKLRVRRNVNKLFGGNIYDWPTEMNHLLLAPEKEKPRGVNANSFNGIHIQKGNKTLTEKVIEIKPTESAPRAHPIDDTTVNIPVNATVFFSTSTTAKILASTTTTSPSTITTTPPVSPPSTTSASPSTTISSTIPTSTEATPTTTKTITARTRTHGTQVIVKAVQPVRSNRLEALNRKHLPEETTIISVTPQTTVPPTTQTERTTPKATTRAVTNRPTTTTSRPSTLALKPQHPLKSPEVDRSQHELDENEFPDVIEIPSRSDGAYKLDVQYSDLLQKLGDSSIEFRRSPSKTPEETLTQIHLKPIQGKVTDKAAKAADLNDNKPKKPEHTWKVVEDPHKLHRQRALKQLLAEEGNPTSASEHVLYKNQPLDKRIALPEIRQKQAFFNIQNGAKLNDYHWFGLYDHCEGRHLKLVSLRGVEPPREERIMPLSGWSNSVSSYRVHILNCNTILIPGFTFDPSEGAHNSFFVAGIGDFPNQIEKQVKINVVGEKAGQPLRKYDNEDVLLRLPRTYRTFDIDFLSVFNMNTQKSMGHVIIPSLLVPPCQED